MSSDQKSSQEGMFNRSEKTKDIRSTNIQAAKGVADVIRTSLGPRGMDKMIQDSRGEVLITNDGATILKQMEVVHPTAKMLVEISKAQDIEAGDGTTTVVIIAGALLRSCELLLEKGIHPNVISEGYQLALEYAQKVINELKKPVDLDNKEQLIQCVVTSLSSKIVSQNSAQLAPIAVEAVLKLLENKEQTNVDLRDIRVVKKLGGTVEETELVNGIVFQQLKAHTSNGGPSKMEKAKIAVCQFQLSSPKTDTENSIIVKDYTQMDRILKEERKYVAELVKKIVSSGCNVVMIQKSIIKEAYNELTLNFLAKKGIMTVLNFERDDIEFICKSIGAVPISHIDQMRPEKFGYADLIQEIRLENDTRVLKITGVPAASKTMTIFCRGSNQLILDEAERSIHDALCVMRSLVKVRGLLPGGGAPEGQISVRLNQYSKSLSGTDALCVRAFAEALEVIPYTLAENAGLNPIQIVTELRNKHLHGYKYAGISMRKGNVVEDISEESVLQPALVNYSALTLATECVRMILKIDDLVISAR